VLTSIDWKNVWDWSPDGRTIVFSQVDRERSEARRNATDIWALTHGASKPYPIVKTDDDEFAPRFSPDGQWILYESNETGTFEVFLQRFPGPGGRVRVSTNGIAMTSFPQWRMDGRELFYVASDNRLMAVPFTPVTGRPGAPVPTFVVPPGSEFIASPDGSRFLISEVVEQAAPITILLNWSGRGN
jgi:Tol biopolymer transport system component